MWYGLLLGLLVLSLNKDLLLRKISGFVEVLGYDVCHNAQNPKIKHQPNQIL